MRAIWFLLLLLPFSIPAHFYPVPTYFEELLASNLLVLLFVLCVASSATWLRYNAWVIWWVTIGVVWLVSWLFNQKEIISGAYFYQLFWVLGLFSLMVGAHLTSRYGQERLVRFTARALVFSGFLYACTGLFAYYGGLKFILPWISKDHHRLVGLMEHPNLSGLYLGISIAAMGYQIARGYSRLKSVPTVGFLSIVPLSGVLTGSRAFFLILGFQLLVAIVWHFSAKRTNDSTPPAAGRSVLRYQASVLLLSVVLFFAFPFIDGRITHSLASEGVLDRASTSEMLTERFRESSGAPRLGEWRKIIQGLEVVDNVWVGVGPGAYSEFSVEADSYIDSPFRNGRTWRNAHNIVLMALVEWGIVGAAFIVAFIAYLIWVFFRAARTPENLCVWLIVVAILVHNLVEFSLWHLQFLIVFLILISTQVGTKSLRLTTPSLRWWVAAPVIALSAWIAITSTRDFSKMVYLFSKHELVEEDIKSLDLIAQNSLWRPYARLVMYYRMNPYVTGLENQLREASLVAEWSPLNLALMRQATLTAGIGDTALACERIYRATELYPAISATLKEELVYLESNGASVKASELEACIAPRSSP